MHDKNSSPKFMLRSSSNTLPITQIKHGKSPYRSESLHKRNASFDAASTNKHEFYYSNGLFGAQDTMKQIYQNSSECEQFQIASSAYPGIDQTNSRNSSIESHLLHKCVSNSNKKGKSARQGNNDTLTVANESPIRRSSSFCNRNMVTVMPTKTGTPKSNRKQLNRPSSENSQLQKSASSSSFKKLAASSPFHQHYQETENEFFIINGNDNLRTTCDEILFSSDESNDMSSSTTDIRKPQTDRQKSEPPISHTRYNKAFLMRMEQNRQTKNESKGVKACPNTPELSRRAINVRSLRDPTSMPRDSSLSRMKQGLPNLQSTKNALSNVPSKDSSISSTCSAKQRVLPKYMDISKYKPAQGQSFLKRDESKSTLVSRNEIRKSPSATGLSKHDILRSSGRIKSAGAKPTTPNAKGNTMNCDLHHK